MGIKDWARRQVIGSVVGSLNLQEVAVAKWLLALIAAAVPLFAGVVPGLENNTLTVGALGAAVSAAILAALGKIMDPGATLHVPRIGKAVVLAIGATIPMLAAASADGFISGQEWGGILATLLTVAWAKWTQPDKIAA